ncbi:MAG: TOBE domain-containing protein [Cyclobacteriaceae bacterium]
MNTLKGIVEEVSANGSLSLVRINVGDLDFSAIVIETPESADYLSVGADIKVIFKETEVVIGKGSDHNISLQNRIPGTINTLESGELLSKITIDSAIGDIQSIVTSNAVKQLQLEVGSEVTAMIKTNEIMLSP